MVRYFFRGVVLFFLIGYIGLLGTMKFEEILLLFKYYLGLGR